MICVIIQKKDPHFITFQNQPLPGFIPLKMKTYKNIEYITWKKSGQEVIAVAFVVAENKIAIEIALTHSFNRFTDIIKIKKIDILSRAKVKTTVRTW